LLQPFAQPFGLLLNLVGLAVLAIHAAEYLLFKERLSNQQQPLLQALQVILFGIFHLLSLTDQVSAADADMDSGLQMEAENA
jgi:putative membrane protein